MNFKVYEDLFKSISIDKIIISFIWKICQDFGWMVYLLFNGFMAYNFHYWKQIFIAEYDDNQDDGSSSI